MQAIKIVRALFLCLGLLWVSITVQAVDESWKIIINIPECQLYLYHNGGLFKIYQVAIGKLDSPSPTGEFRIINKVVNPTWYPEGQPPVPPGPKNPLGKYWMGLNNKGYGIHGNSAAWSIGAPASNGCFRMDNQAIKELFSIVPVGTEVKVIYSTVKGRIDHKNQAWIEIFPDIYQRFKFEDQVQQVFDQLNWEYQPHLLALACLLNARKLSTIVVPRKIQIQGDYSDLEVDGFYWNDRLYLRGDFLNTDVALALPKDELFKGYLIWNPVAPLRGDEYKLEWDQALNTLSIYALKININGEKVTEGVRFGEQRQILVNYPKLSDWFDVKQLLRAVLVIETTEGNRFSGEVINGELWVEFEKLLLQLTAVKYRWEEATWSLEVAYRWD